MDLGEGEVGGSAPELRSGCGWPATATARSTLRHGTAALLPNPPSPPLPLSGIWSLAFYWNNYELDLTREHTYGSSYLIVQRSAGSVKQDDLPMSMEPRSAPRGAFADTLKEDSASNIVALQDGRPEKELRLLVLNTDGIGKPSSDANAELKIRDVCHMVQRHDVAVLVETRTKKLDRMMHYLPSYAVLT
eukprot:1155324-Pelagomonas_calceolata.AAC.1